MNRSFTTLNRYREVYPLLGLSVPLRRRAPPIVFMPASPMVQDRDFFRALRASCRRVERVSVPR